MIMASISSACANPGPAHAIYWERSSFFAMPSDVAVEIRLFATRCLSLQ